MACENIAELPPIVTRKEAKAQKLPRYFTGRSCPHGHIAERYTSGGACSVCMVVTLEKRRRDKGISPRTAQSREEFVEKRRVLNIKWKAKNRRRLAEEASAYYKANIERRREYHKNYARKNSAEIVERVRRWCKQNPEKARAARAKNNARRKGAEGSFSSADIQAIGASQKWRCAGCNKALKGKFHIDHITAISRGGSNWPSNLQILCPPCNLSKHASDPIEWAQRNGRLL